MNIVKLGCRCGTFWFFNLPSAKNFIVSLKFHLIWPIFPNDSESLPKVCYIKRKNSEFLSKLRNSEPAEVSVWQTEIGISGSNGTTDCPYRHRFWHLSIAWSKPAFIFIHFKSNQNFCILNKSTQMPVYIFKTHVIN